MRHAYRSHNSAARCPAPDKKDISQYVAGQKYEEKDLEKCSMFLARLCMFPINESLSQPQLCRGDKRKRTFPYFPISYQPIYNNDFFEDLNSKYFFWPGMFTLYLSRTFVKMKNFATHFQIMGLILFLSNEKFLKNIPQFSNL